MCVILDIDDRVQTAGQLNVLMASIGARDAAIDIHALCNVGLDSGNIQQLAAVEFQRSQVAPPQNSRAGRPSKDFRSYRR